MNRTRNTLIILFSALAILLIAYFAIFNKDKKHFLWREDYRAESKQPYGVSFIKKMMETYKPEGKFIYNKKKNLKIMLDSAATNGNADYVFIGQQPYYTQEDAEALLEFVNRGNNAFISSFSLPENLSYRVLTYECNTGNEYLSVPGITVHMNFFHDTLRTPAGYPYAFQRFENAESYNWQAIAPEMFCDSTKLMTPLGFFDLARVNFVRVKYGQGNFYIHTTPLSFTNYFMKDPTGVDYASGVFSHLPGKDIIWDEYSKLSFRSDDKGENNPLYFLLAQPSLKYAWWLMLLAVFLYVIFAAKRTQRIIPVMETKANTSLEFVNLISSLHFKNGDHLDIARKKMKYFLYFIRAKYGIHAQTFKEEQIARLAEKSKVATSDIRAIFSKYEQIEAHAHYNTTIDRMVDLYDAIENFYKQCK